MSGEGGVITTDLRTMALLSCCVRGRKSYSNRPAYSGIAHCCLVVPGEGVVISTDLSTVVLLSCVRGRRSYNNRPAYCGTVVLLCQGKEEL